MRRGESNTSINSFIYSPNQFIMKKKVFSLMMTLLLAFVGVAKAEVVTIGDGTGTTYYAPFNSLWGYSFVEQVYTASEIGTAGTINAISFNMSSTDAQTNQVDVFMKNVSRTNFSDNTDWEPVTASDMVFSGTVTFNNGWTTITLDTPFQYDGTSNLMIGMHEYTSGYSTRYFYYTSVTGGLISGHSDTANPDPYNMGSFSGTTYVQNYRANIQIDITAGGGGETVEVTIGDPTSTSSSSYLPTYSLYNYSLTQQIYTADEIGTAGTINTLTMWLKNTSSYARNLNFYMKEVTESAFADGNAWVSMSSSNLVGSMTLANGISDFTETTINLSAPFSYTGNGNLLICVQDVTGSWSSGAYGNTMTANGNQALYAYRDASVYDIANPGESGYTLTSKNVVRLSITTEGGGGGGFEDHLHVKYMAGEEEVIDSLNMGVRPLGAWMEPFNFTMYTDGPAYTVTVLDFTPSDGMFTVEGEELPFEVVRDQDVELTMTTNATQAGLIERQFVAITEGNRAAHIWPIIVEVYDPEIPDVVEKAYDFGTIEPGFSDVRIPADITPTTLHNDYDLPFDEIEEGVDAVYKFKVENDLMIDAYVSQGADGKVALYTEDFYGEGGPMATNNYTGPQMGGGSGSTMPYEALIGDEASTSTTGYFPMYYLYNYSLSTQLFTAAELAEAGANTAAMSSVAWYSESTYNYNVQNVSIWMANVADAVAPTMSPLASGMTLVYQGNFQEVVGWNEFEFNAGSFAWDGTSNVLVMVQMNNGNWSSTIYWKSHNPGFQAMTYAYTDSAPYDATTTSYSLYTSTTARANTRFTSLGGRNGNRDVVTIGEQTGSSYYYYPANMYFNYSFSEQIYTADEIGTAGTINSISFYYNYSSSFTMNNLTLFMKNTDKEEFASTMDMEPMTSSDVVWNGTMSATAPGWVTITLDTPFQYDGTSNLLVGMFDGTNGYPGSSYVFYTHTTTGSKGLTWYSDSYTPDPYTATSWSGSTNRSSYVNDIQLDITPGGAGVDYVAGPVIEDLPLTPGTYYLVSSSTDPDFEVTINAEEMPCPEVEGFAFNPTPADDEDGIEPASVTLRWSLPAYATGWRLIFGSTYHPEPGHPQTIMYPEDGSFSTELANSYTVRNLWNNTHYFWRVEFNNGGCEEGVSSPVWGFTTHLNIPQNLTVVDETVFNDEQIVLNWTAVVDRTFRMYNVYRDGELIGTTQVNNIGNATYTDGPLAYNMSGYTYYVTAIYDEGESAPSNTVNVKVSGYGDVNGHVYEQDGTTGIAGATVTMVGQDEFGVNHTYNFTTDNQGYYTGHIYAGAAYDGQAAKEGYQTDYEPEQGEPIVITYNNTTSPIDYILDENFDPVCTVIAEYYPDSLDPNSPYVKVYWGCGLPGEEIIEPFETGDFSLFDWQVDPSYPWSITTTNPYEGTYCMQSGGAGVASVTSNMTVTVEIPADGEMSYFGKISCEQNWDYGYFYIDGVQKAQYTGVSNWAEKKFDITAGTHTFMWQYTKDGSVNANDDRFYVDYITFYRRPEPPQPAQPGWHTYAEGDFNNAVGSNVGTSRWAYQYPISVIGGYAGFTMTKVSLFSDTQYMAVGGNYTCTIYQGGAEPMAGTAISTITVDVPSGQNAWVDFDLTTPVNVTGSDVLWVVWTANTTVSSWPAGCTDVSLIEEGTWWNPGVEGGYAWEHQTYGTWTMRQYFTNREGRGFYSYADNAHMPAIEVPVVAKGAPAMPVKGQEVVTTTCATTNPAPVARFESNNRSLNHYRVYRTNCYQECPFTEDNTVLLATVWVPDTVYIDVEWADLPAGVYKWGVGAVYEGNRGELIEGPINWTAPQVINRSNTAEVSGNAIQTAEVNRAPWDLIGNFNAAEAAHYGVATDGQYLYTCNWGYSSAAYNFYKYDLSGNVIEGFNISGSGTIRDLAYDGQYFYGGANSSTLYCLDLANHTLVSSVSTGCSNIRHCAYDPVNDGFWVGGWDNLMLINRSGAVVTTAPAPTSCGGSGYYTAEDGSAHVYLYCEPTYVYDYDIASNTISSSPIFSTTNIPGWDGSSTVGGAEVAEYNGTVCFFGDIQQSPNIIGIYELRSGGVGPQPTPEPGMNCNELALPRESETIWSNCLDKDMYLVGEDNAVTVNVLLNSADSPEGVQVSFTNYNEAEQEMYPVAPIILDETGFYAFESFRKGEYKVEVTFDGYEPITDSVSIWNPIDLRYVMTEIIYGVDNLYVSSTGWAMWDAQGAAPTPGPNPGPNPQPGDDVTVILTCGDVWGDGSGYQMLLDADANAFGTTIPETGALSMNCSGNEAIYAEFEYKIPANADGNCSTTNIVYNNSVSITIPAGTYDWCITNPTPGDRIWIASEQGNVGGRQNDYTFEAGNTYEFTVTLQGSNDATNVTITGGAKNMVAPMPAGEVKDIANVVVTNTRHLEYFKVMCTSIDGEPIFNADVPASQPFCQLNVEDLVEGEHYICKVAAVYSTGMSAWSECEWQYIACTNYAGTLNGIEVNGTTVTWDYPTGPGPQPGQGSTFNEGFEGGMPAGWTRIDANNDGNRWEMTTDIPTAWPYYASLTLDWYRTGTNAICSGSYINGVGAITPDDYLVTPQVTLVNGSTFSFYAAATDASYPADHFGVFVSDNGTSDWTMVNEWTLTAKGGNKAGDLRASRDGNGNRLGSWHQYSVDLSAFAGQKYIAIRHFNCNDQYIMCVDDIELSAGAKNDRAAWDLMMTFNAAEAGHYGLAYDGTNFYTSNWGYSSAAYNFYKYDLTGNMIEGFNISGCGTLRGITYDGQYFYGVANSNTVYCVDLANHSVVSTFTSSYGAMRGITYDPVRDGFWVIGNWSGNLTLIDRTGAVQQTGPAPESASDLAYYKDENDVEHIYCFNNGTNDVNDWVIGNGSMSGSVFNFNNLPGTTGTSGGCNVASFNGKIAFMGDIQQDPNLIGIYELRDDTNPGPGPGPTPSGNVLGAMVFLNGEWEAFVPYPTNEYTFAEAGDYCVRMVYDGTNTLPEGNIYYSMSCPECTEGDDCAPVLNLVGQYMNNEGMEGLYVDWEDPEGATSIRLYADGELIGELPAGQHPIFLGFDGQVPEHTFVIGAQAIHPDCESEIVEVEVYYDDVIENEANVALFPNPTTDNVTIQAEGMSHITVTSVLGQVVYDADVNGDEMVLNMGQFNAGMYMVRINTANGVVVKRVTVMQ